jgi:hypothetical protein
MSFKQKGLFKVRCINDNQSHVKKGNIYTVYEEFYDCGEYFYRILENTGDMSNAFFKWRFERLGSNSKRIN